METMDDGKYYRISGRVSPAFIPWLIIGILAIAILSYIYAIAMFHNPYIYLSIVLTILFGIFMGFATAKATQWGKVRNVVICWAILLVFFATFVYVHFTAYAAVVFRETSVIDVELFFILLENPAYTVELYTQWIVPYGVWSIGESADADSAVSGWMLVTVWGIEHILIAGAAFLMVRHYALNKPFFEMSGKWGVEKECAFGWEYQSPAAFPQLRNALENGNIEHFRTLTPAKPASPQSCSLSCFTDPSGESRDVYLSLDNVTVEFDKKGRMSKKKEPIVKHLSFPETAYNQLEEIVKEAAYAQQQQMVQQMQQQGDSPYATSPHTPAEDTTVLR